MTILDMRRPDDVAFLRRHAREWFLDQIDPYDPDGADQYADWLVEMGGIEPPMLSRTHPENFRLFQEDCQ